MHKIKFSHFKCWLEINSSTSGRQNFSFQTLPVFAQSWQSATARLCCCDWWCWYVSLRGNSSCSYLCFILTETLGSVLANKGCRVLCGVHLGLVQFTVNTLAGASRRSHMSFCVWRLLSRCFHRVRLQLVMERVGKTHSFKKTEEKGFLCCVFA